jgi:hypothetical protein
VEQASVWNAICLFMRGILYYSWDFQEEEEEFALLKYHIFFFRVVYIFESCHVSSVSNMQGV